MPFVEGESLRDRLQRERQLPVEEALRITREAAQGLQYAHEHGVVHRDIKPENLLLAKDGSTLVADFGIARALGGEEQLTQTGMSVGTPAYMSPEQSSGEQALDARTDVYSLGSVLYEMLVGEPPFTGPTAQAIIARRLTEPAPDVRRGRPAVPAPLAQALEQALAPIAADRFATARDLVNALQPSTTVSAVSARTTARRRVPLAAVTLVFVVLIGLGALFAWRRTPSGTGGHAGEKVLAVLPFENLGDSADAYFADGVANEVRGKLSQLADLAVIARASSNEYRHTTKRPEEIARELGADYLLTATVQWEKMPGGASRVRVTPELVRVEPGAAPTMKWQRGFDAALTDVFRVQAEIAQQVASALDVALGDSVEHELAAKPTASLEAYDAFLKGEAAALGTAATDPASLRRAIGFYERAVALDSTFVPAWAQLAIARAVLYANSMPTPQLAAAAREAAQQALTLGPGRHEGQEALGFYYSAVALDHRQALAAYEAGLKLAPNDADLLGAAGAAEQNLGRWEAALAHQVQASALDPRSAGAARRTAGTLLWLRRLPEAQTAIERGLVLAPTNLQMIELKAMVALARGDLAGARAVVRSALASLDSTAVYATFGNYWDLYWVLDDTQQQRLLALPPGAFDNDRGSWAIVRAQTHALRGNQTLARAYADSARLAIEEQLRATPDDDQRHLFLGLALAYLGQRDSAIAEGERAAALMPLDRDALSGAYDQHQLVRIYLLVGEPEKALDHLEPLLRMPYYLSPGWLRIDPTFEPLRGNLRFERLVAGR